MPEIFRKFGFSFKFYSQEHEPIHIHVVGNGINIAFDLIDDEFILRKTESNLKANDIKRIIAALESHKQDIIDKWTDYFKDTKFG